MSEFYNCLTLWLLGCCAILSLIITLELAVPDSTTTTASASSPQSGLPELPRTERYVPPTMAAYSAALEQPVFFQTRKMPEVAVAPSTPPAALRLRLEGIAVSGDHSIAVLRNLNDNQLVQLAPGGSHDGWRLAEVDSTGVTFERDGRITALALEIGDKRRR